MNHELYQSGLTIEQCAIRALKDVLDRNPHLRREVCYGVLEGEIDALLKTADEAQRTYYEELLAELDRLFKLEFES